MELRISRIQRLSAVIGISMSFFVAEIAVGFYTGSLALIADAFHYLSDIIGFMVALVAAVVETKNTPPQSLTFGWQRSQLVGAFFNGVLLFGLGISIFLQSLERFITLENGHGHDNTHTQGHSSAERETGNEISPDSGFPADEKHTHHKHSLNAKPKPKRNFDLALMGVFIHIMGDCANNLGVIIAGLVIWLADYHGRYYADPAVSMAIAVMIFCSSLPLIKRSGLILLQSAPDGVEHEDVKHDLLQIQGIRAVHELHIWRLNQKKSLASAHIVLEDGRAGDFPALAKTVKECFHAYGIHSVTLQPETPVVQKGAVAAITGVEMERVEDRESHDQDDKYAGEKCHLLCGNMCTDLACCE
ncbi:hypothetical protein ASPVEDRAFT_142590 [Aspergillus versicolor CBS 583.65]|uniref:Cation efflux protein cytoplasmic domain-containing protein n=1 Tax=Aspergillus versicolor CBS 583.65 TaxID=1036611 RepID=A0A1L9Q1G1_ASPVE|nr:uncharacterized protein ASPVEDRAFT_142590 [Aspergillus versicolor CBS 583.65]OJJ07556.1 hypothetical protein ASPVEDRAFT_142590 [Aspergillus versicolor CBS 583.65]